MIGNEQWSRYIYTIYPLNGKKVSEIEYSLVADKMEGNLQVTDMQFQEGRSISAPIPETRDILSPVDFNIDEFAFIKTISNPLKEGTQPIYHENVRNRFYNITGRGHQVVSIPNVFHEDYTFPIVTTGLDISLKAKEDFDLLRIRTHDGALDAGRKYSADGPLKDHPLNYRYTREFYFDGAKAGELIELKSTIRAAKINGRDVPLKQHKLEINGSLIPIDRQRFMLAPAGSFRLGIEFYKQVTEEFTDENGETYLQTYLKDTGIGFYGVAELNQWTYGVSKL